MAPYRFGEEIATIGMISQAPPYEELSDLAQEEVSFAADIRMALALAAATVSNVRGLEKKLPGFCTSQSPRAG